MTRESIRHLLRTLTLAGAVSLGLGCTSLQASRHYADGTAALDRGDSAVAVHELEEAASLWPEASEVHNHLGLAYAQSGRRNAAEAAFRRAVELDCTNDAAQHNLRAAEAGRFDGASRVADGASREARLESPDVP